MNRDEKRIRGNEIAPKEYNGLLYPLDIASNGTWAGVNTKTLKAAFLLNRYDKTQYKPTSSRGSLVPFMLNNGDINILNLTEYAPFHLIELHNSQLISHKWNGSRLIIAGQIVKNSYFTSSSSWNEQEVLQYRQSNFEQWQKADRPYTGLYPSINLQQEPKRKEYSILVDREQTYTKSITQFIIENGKVNANYLPEPKNTML